MEKVKSLNVSKCPHCQGEILIEFNVTPPEVVGVITEADVVTAKNQVMEAIRNTKGISEEDKEKAFSWIMNEDTVFGPGEVDQIIKDIQEQK